MVIAAAFLLGAIVATVLLGEASSPISTQSFVGQPLDPLVEEPGPNLSVHVVRVYATKEQAARIRAKLDSLVPSVNSAQFLGVKPGHLSLQRWQDETLEDDRASFLALFFLEFKSQPAALDWPAVDYADEFEMTSPPEKVWPQPNKLHEL